MLENIGCADVKRLVFEHIPLAQRSWWLVCAAQTNMQHFIELLPHVTIDDAIVTQLIECVCADALRELFRDSNRMTDHWQTIQRLLFESDDIPRFVAIYDNLDLSRRCDVFNCCCHQGKAQLLSLCHSIPANVVQATMLQLFDFSRPDVSVLQHLLERYECTPDTQHELREECVNKLHRFFAVDVAAMHLLLQHAIIDPKNYKLYFGRALYQGKQDHVEFFWKPGFSFELYMPTITNQTDDNVDNDHIAENVHERKTNSSYHRVFNSFCDRIHFNDQDSDFSRAVIDAFAKYLVLAPSGMVTFFAECCEFQYRALVQYLWNYSDDTLRQQFAKAFDRCDTFTDRKMIDFVWECCPNVFVANKLRCVTSALQKHNCTLWTFLVDHDIVDGKYLFEAYQIANLCRASPKMFQLVWRNTPIWIDNYEKLFEYAHKAKQSGILKFLTTCDAPKTQRFLVTYFPLWVSLESPHLIRAINDLHKISLNYQIDILTSVIDANNRNTVPFSDLWEWFRFKQQSKHLHRELLLMAIRRCKEVAVFLARQDPDLLDASILLIVPNEFASNLNAVLATKHFDIDFKVDSGGKNWVRLFQTLNFCT